MHKYRINSSLNSAVKVAPFTGKSFLSCTAAGHEHVGNWKGVRKRERSCFMHLIEGLSDKLHADGDDHKLCIRRRGRAFDGFTVGGLLK